MIKGGFHGFSFKLLRDDIVRFMSQLVIFMGMIWDGFGIYIVCVHCVRKGSADFEYKCYLLLDWKQFNFV